MINSLFPSTIFQKTVSSLSQLGALGAILLSTSNVSAAPKKASTAKVPALVQLRANSVLSPQFFLKNSKESVEAGSAFVVRHPKSGAFVLCTAFHIFLAEANGMAKDSNPDRVVRAIARSGTGTKVFSGTIVPLKTDKEGNSEDFLAFKVTKHPSFAFRFAKKNARIGETVWVLGPTAYKGKSLGVSSSWLTVELEDKNAYLTGYSGAPIINSRGEVVGMTQSGGEGIVTGLSSATMRSVFP